METWLLYVAGGAMLLAVLMWLTSRGKKSASQTGCCSDSPAMGTMAVPSVKPKGPPPPMPPMPSHLDKDGRKKRFRNTKGWTAPAGHYFNDDGELFTDDGDLITDMLMIANLCGIDDYVEEAEVIETAEPVGTETIASGPGISEVSPSSDLHTAPSIPVSASEPARSYTPDPTPNFGGGDSGGGDSGGGD